MDDLRCDVVVVGGGPAGATAGKVLAERGASVLIVDKQRFPRDKPCGGGIPVRALKHFPYLVDVIDSYSFGLSVFSSSLAHQAVIQHREPVIAMVRRSVFDADLVRLAVERGARFKEGVAVERVRADGPMAEVVLTDGAVLRSSAVVVADGNGSRLARCLGYRYDMDHIGVNVVEEHPVDRKTMDEVFGEGRRVQIFMNPLGCAGYGWVFPKAECVNIGIGEFYHAIPQKGARRNLNELYAGFLRVLKERRLIPAGIHAVHPKGGVFPTKTLSRLSVGCAAVCGDAAGLTNPLTGEGIFSAMVSGELAAKAILSSLDGGGINGSGLASYQRDWMRGYGEDYRKYYWVSKRWKEPAERFVQVVGSDAQLRNLAVSLMTQDVKVRGFVWTMGPRLMTGYIKSRIGRF